MTNRSVSRLRRFVYSPLGQARIEQGILSGLGNRLGGGLVGDLEDGREQRAERETANIGLLRLDENIVAGRKAQDVLDTGATPQPGYTYQTHGPGRYQDANTAPFPVAPATDPHPQGRIQQRKPRHALLLDATKGALETLAEPVGRSFVSHPGP